MAKVAETDCCALCSNKIRNQNYEIINEVIKEIFDVFPKLNIDGSSSNVICHVCYKKLLAAFQFKSTCLYTEDIIFPYINDETSQLCLKEIYLKEKENSHLISSRDLKICRLCMKPITTNFESMQSLDVNVMQEFIPEMNFKIVKDPVVCELCYDAFGNHSSFLMNCIKPCCPIVKLENEELHIKSEEMGTETQPAEIKEKGLVDGTSFREEAEEEEIQGHEVVQKDEPENEINNKEDERSAKRLYICHDCKYESTCRNNFVVHLRKHVDPLKLQMFQTKHKNSLTEHLLVQDADGSLYKCDRCGYETKLRNAFKHHRQLGKDWWKVQKCHSCDFETRYSRCLLTHIKSHGVLKYECDKCSFETWRKPIFVQHQPVHREPAEIRMYSCDRCEYQNKQKHNLKIHMLKHMDPSEVKVYRCDRCEYATRTNACLKVHQLRHKDRSEMKMYKCAECTYESKFRHCLVSHRKVHADPSQLRMYKCDECAFQTKYKKSLRTHEKAIHRDVSETPTFQCDKCSFKTSNASSVSVHKRLHKDFSEVRVYKCDRCDFESRYKDSISKHQQRHEKLSKRYESNETRKHKCDKCSYATKNKAHLARHQVTHENASRQEVYTCEKCGYKSKRKRYLVLHLKLRH